MSRSHYSDAAKRAAQRSLRELSSGRCRAALTWLTSSHRALIQAQGASEPGRNVSEAECAVALSDIAVRDRCLRPTPLPTPPRRKRRQ